MNKQNNTEAIPIEEDIDVEELKKAFSILENRFDDLYDSGKPLSPGLRDLTELIKMTKSDDNLATRMADLYGGTPEDIIALGKEKDLIFNEDDMKVFYESLLGSSEYDELEDVAGGFSINIKSLIRKGTSLVLKVYDYVDPVSWMIKGAGAVIEVCYDIGKAAGEKARSAFD